MTKKDLTKKELKKLSRAELLELLLVQTLEVERLREELEETKQLLEDKKIRVEKAGSLADAVLQVNEVVNAAQKAADQYLENIIAMEKETKQQCVRLLQVAEEESKRVWSESNSSKISADNDLKKKKNSEKLQIEELQEAEFLRNELQKAEFLRSELQKDDSVQQDDGQTLQTDLNEGVNKKLDEVQEV